MIESTRFFGTLCDIYKKHITCEALTLPHLQLNSSFRWRSFHRIHLYSHIFHSIYFDGTKRHDEQKKREAKSIPFLSTFFTVAQCFSPFLKSASFARQNESGKKSTQNINRIVIPSKTEERNGCKRII